ncbi:hypothetical protein AAY473_002003 [Plecturocebus cupreus]
MMVGPPQPCGTSGVQWSKHSAHRPPPYKLKQFSHSSFLRTSAGYVVGQMKMKGKMRGCTPLHQIWNENAVLI